MHKIPSQEAAVLEFKPRWAGSESLLLPWQSPPGFTLTLLDARGGCTNPLPVCCSCAHVLNPPLSLKTPLPADLAPIQVFSRSSTLWRTKPWGLGLARPATLGSWWGSLPPSLTTADQAPAAELSAALTLPTLPCPFKFSPVQDPSSNPHVCKPIS